MNICPFHALHVVASQHYRIIRKGSSEGFSPWFLLLGSTSSASGMLNMYAQVFVGFPVISLRNVNVTGSQCNGVS